MKCLGCWGRGSSWCLARIAYLLHKLPVVLIDGNFWQDYPDRMQYHGTALYQKSQYQSMVTQFLVDLSRYLSNALAKSTPVSATQGAGSYTELEVCTYHVPRTPAQLWDATLLDQHPAIFNKNSFLFYGSQLSHYIHYCIPDGVIGAPSGICSQLCLSESLVSRLVAQSLEIDTTVPDEVV